MEDLSKRQKQILEYIIKEVHQKGYPPSVREIGEAVGLSSSSTVHAHLARLEEMGYLRRDPTKPRAIEVLIGGPASENTVTIQKDLIHIPVLGTVTAGAPILATENIQDYFPLPRDFTKTDSAFMLRIKGDSMINAGIFDGDLVVVSGENQASNGDIVVALLEEEATVKRFFKEKNAVRLQPENEKYEPIISDNVKILGRVVGLVRKFH